MKVLRFIIFLPIIVLSGPAGLLLTLIGTLSRYKKYLQVERIGIEESYIPRVEVKRGGSINDENFVISIIRSGYPKTLRSLKQLHVSAREEVRLLTFSFFSDIEKEIFKKIDILNKKLSQANEREKPNILYKLASLNWELVFSGITEKEMKEFHLKKALDYCLSALEIKRDSKISFLGGRICLAMGDTERAEHLLKEAIELGMPYEKVALYLMEVYFLKRDWKKVIEIGESVKDIPDEKVIAITRVWV